jgi:hypothetical protein
MQGSHGVSRNWLLGTRTRCRSTISQSLGAAARVPDGLTSRGWSHGLGLFWQSSGNGSQSFAGLSLNDSRTAGPGRRGHFQLINLQVSRRTQLSRHNSWSASLTLQATRSDAELLDPFTGTLRMQSDGWQRFYSGALTFESQRVFGMPRLRFTGLATVNSQQIERRRPVTSTRRWSASPSRSRPAWTTASAARHPFSARLARIDGAHRRAHRRTRPAALLDLRTESAT